MRLETFDGKSVSTDLHGLIDYTAGVLSLVVPRALGGSERALAVGNAAAVFAGTYAAVTKFERGCLPLLSMRQHLALDALFGVGFLAAAALLPREKPAVRVAFVGFGLFAIWASQNTETVSPMERAERGRV